MSQHVYFVEEGLASVVLTMENGATIEVSVIGRDGVVGLPMLLGGRQMPGKTFVQVEGSGFRMDAQFVKEQFEQPGQLRNQLQKYLVAQSSADCSKCRLQSAAHDQRTTGAMATYVP